MKLTTEKFLVCKFNGKDFDISINKNEVEIKDSDIESNFIVIPIENDYIIIWNSNFKYLPELKKVKTNTGKIGTFSLNSDFNLPNSKVWSAKFQGPFKPIRTNLEQDKEIDSLFKENGFNISLDLYLWGILKDIEENNLWNINNIE